MTQSYIKVSKPTAKDGENEKWDSRYVSPTLNVFENQSDVRATVLIVENNDEASKRG